MKSFWPVVDRSWKSMRAVCDDASCHNTQLMRSIPGGRTGIQCGDRWYCSVDCFARGSRAELTSLSNAHFNENPRIPRMSMGLTLLAKGYLNVESLRFAQIESERHRETLETTLTRLCLVSEKQLAAARAAQWGYPVLAQDRIGQTVESDIPQYLLQQSAAVPLDYSVKAKRILLGFVFRVDHSLLESIEKVTGCKVVPCFITATAVSYTHLIWKSGLILFAWAGVDYLLLWLKNEGDLKMSRQDIRDELKQSEGNPESKARIRRIQRQMRRKQMIKAAETATVVITNPTHYAVALRYEADMAAPMVVAKGRDYLAARIKEVARLHDIPVMENRPLAQALYKGVEVGDPISADLYHAVAEILVLIYKAQTELRLSLIHIFP